jgi:hypothetical protein
LSIPPQFAFLGTTSVGVTLSITTSSLMTFNSRCSPKCDTDTQHSNALHYAECHYAEYCVLFIVMLTVYILNINMQSVAMMNVVLLSVVAPIPLVKFHILPKV